MNIKIKSSGVSCLIGDDYDKVFSVLKKQFGQGSCSLFTERIPGHEYLQWILPDNGWTALSEGDPIMAEEVRRELKLRMQMITEKFGANTAMAQKVLTVPDDSYVYYRADANGMLDIKLTAWGYRYPERITGGDVIADIAPDTKQEKVVIRFENDGKPMVNKEFRLNGFKRTADSNGELEVGMLDVGYGFDLEIDGKKQHFTVEESKGNIVIDCTEFTTVEVKATLDGVPYANANVNVVYGIRNMQLITDATGRATTKVPLSINGDMCSATLDNETQQMLLKSVMNTFVFNLQSPAKEDIPEEPKEPKEDSPVKQEEPQEDENPKELPPVEQEEPKVEEHPEEQPPVESEEPKEPKKEEKKTFPWSMLWGCLMTLILAILVILSYLFGTGMMFG